MYTKQDLFEDVTIISSCAGIGALIGGNVATIFGLNEEIVSALGCLIGVAIGEGFALFDTHSNDREQNVIF